MKCRPIKSGIVALFPHPSVGRRGRGGVFVGFQINRRFQKHLWLNRCSTIIRSGRKTMPLDESTIGCFIYPDATPETIDKLDYSDLNPCLFLHRGSHGLHDGHRPRRLLQPARLSSRRRDVLYFEGYDHAAYCPTTGQVIRVKAGESLLIPKGTVHVAYNFEDEDLRVMAVIAPKILAGHSSRPTRSPRKATPQCPPLEAIAHRPDHGTVPMVRLPLISADRQYLRSSPSASPPKPTTSIISSSSICSSKFFVRPR